MELRYRGNSICNSPITDLTMANRYNSIISYHQVMLHVDYLFTEKMLYLHGEIADFTNSTCKMIFKIFYLFSTLSYKHFIL